MKKKSKKKILNKKKKNIPEKTAFATLEKDSKKGKNASFENLLKIAMRHIDNDSSNIVR